jgi:acyl-CoA dehydrogenase
MDFTLTPEQAALRARVRAIVDQMIIPLESDRSNYDEHENIAAGPLGRVRALIKTEGLWAPQVSKEWGGLGLDMVGQAVCYEEMGRSIFGPICFNAAAPDDGNLGLVMAVGTAEQKGWWLPPVVAGEARSAFAMTEQHPGAGSDPGGMMLTRAHRVGSRYVIHGRKWFVTGAQGARHFILMARTSDDPRRGLTALLFHADQPGWRITRRIPILGPEEHGGHCELEFDGLEVDESNVLLGEGLGLRVAQIRLNRARLTHCMRWLGMAERAVEIALAYVRERRAFGTTLSERDAVKSLLARAAMDIESGRLLTILAAWLIDQGERARLHVSMAKIRVSETLHTAVDTALQLLGARGYSKDTPIEWMYRYARQARLVDGASEVHTAIIANGLLRDPMELWRWRA